MIDGSSCPRKAEPRPRSEARNPKPEIRNPKRSPACGQGHAKVAEFVVDLVGRGDGLSDFGAETVAETLAESLHGLLDGLLGQIELRRDLGKSQRVLVAPDVVLEQVEHWPATRGSVFGAET